mgnify:FL=1
MPLNTLVTTRRPSPRRAALAVAAVSLVLALAVGCAPQTPVASDGSSETGTDDSATTLAVTSPEEVDAGLLPANTYNEAFVNAGSRGCGSCHGDLGLLMENSGLNHIKIEGEYGKQVTIAEKALKT